MALHTAASEPLATRNSGSDPSGHHVPVEIWQHYNNYFKSSKLSSVRCHCLHYVLQPRSLKSCSSVVAESCDAFWILIHIKFLIKWVKSNNRCSFRTVAVTVVYKVTLTAKRRALCYYINCVGCKVKIILRKRTLVVCIVFCWVWMLFTTKR